MLQLIKKDFFIHKKIIAAMLAVLTIYMLIDISPIFLGLLFAFTMCVHIFSSDEKPATRILLSSLPFTRKEIVSAKYIAAFLYIVLIVALLIVGSMLIDQQAPNWSLIAFVLAASLGVVTVVYPICYRFESKYLMFVFVIGFGIYLLVSNLLMPDFHERLDLFIREALLFMESGAAWLICVLIAALYVGSWFISVQIYTKKEF